MCEIVLILITYFVFNACWSRLSYRTKQIQLLFICLISTLKIKKVFLTPQVVSEWSHYALCQRPHVAALRHRRRCYERRRRTVVSSRYIGGTRVRHRSLRISLCGFAVKHFEVHFFLSIKLEIQMCCGLNTYLICNSV